MRHRRQQLAPRRGGGAGRPHRADGVVSAHVEGAGVGVAEEGRGEGGLSVDLRLRRSFDEGKTWTPSQLVYGNSTEGGNGTAPVWTTVGDGNTAAAPSPGCAARS